VAYQATTRGRQLGVTYSWEKVEDKRRTAMLTAHVARVLAITAETARIDGAESKSNQKPFKVVAPELKRALDYLAARTEEIDEPYLIASYALAALEVDDKTRASAPLQKLQKLAHEEQARPTGRWRRTHHSMVGGRQAGSRPPLSRYSAGPRGSHY
jgi:hypothetical protein